MKHNLQWIRRAAGLALAAFLGLALGITLAAASIMLWPTGSRQTVQPTPAPVAAATRPVAGGTPLPAAPAPEAPTPHQPAKAAQQPASKPSQRVTLLVMGVDERPGEALGRTDTIMLLTMNPDTGAAGMVSLARDLLVQFPGMQQKAKINTAHVYGEINKYPGGGPALLRDTVGELLSYKPDYWVRVNFEGFREIIDQIGGIDIDVPAPIDDPTYPDDNYGYDPLYIPAGHIHMDGKLALKYARTRHVDSDYGRARRQQQVVLAVKNKLTQPGNLAGLLPRLPGLARTLAQSVQTDMSIGKAIELARMINQVDIKGMQSLVVDDKMGANGSDPTWGFVLIPDLNKVRAAAAQVFSDRPGGQLVAQATDPAIRQEAARVALLNGTAQKDLASKVATDLSSEGYRVVGIGIADNQNYAQSWLLSRDNSTPATREALARKFAIAPDHIRSDATDSNVDLVVVLGTDLAQTEAALGGSNN